MSFVEVRTIFVLTMAGGVLRGPCVLKYGPGSGHGRLRRIDEIRQSLPDAADSAVVSEPRNGLIRAFLHILETQGGRRPCQRLGSDDGRIPSTVGVHCLRLKFRRKTMYHPTANENRTLSQGMAIAISEASVFKTAGLWAQQSVCRCCSPPDGVSGPVSPTIFVGFGKFRYWRPAVASAQL